jgi:hypothetical protein
VLVVFVGLGLDLELGQVSVLVEVVFGDLILEFEFALVFALLLFDQEVGIINGGQRKRMVGRELEWHFQKRKLKMEGHQSFDFG